MRCTGALLALVLVACRPPPSTFEFLHVGVPERIELTTDTWTTEIPPWVLDDQVLVSSSSSGLCRLDESLASFPGGSTQACVPLTHGTLDPAISEEALAAIPPWRRNYDALFTLHRAGAEVLGIGHGENKNERIDQRVFLNTINPAIGAECVSQPNPDAGTYDDCWESYHAFVTLSRLDGLSLARVDQGPLAWPVAGFVVDGEKRSHGLRHPSSLIHDGALYVFFVDESFGPEPANEGIRVVRAPLDPLPSASSFRALIDGAFEQPALPSGFDASRTLDFVGVPGPPAPPLFASPEVSSVRFSVARVRHTPWFIGVEERVEADGTWSLGLRLSRDLKQWSEPHFHPGLTALNWDEATLNYPVLLDGSGTTNEEVDANDFFILGTGHSVLHRVRVGLRLPP